MATLQEFLAAGGDPAVLDVPGVTVDSAMQSLASTMAPAPQQAAVPMARTAPPAPLAQTAPPAPLAQTAPPVPVTAQPRPRPAPADPVPAQRPSLSGALAQPGGGRQFTPCDFGFCGDVATFGPAGERPRYMTDGGTGVVWGASPGGRSLLGQMVAAESFTPGRLGAYLQGADQAVLSSARNTPEWGNLYETLLDRTGDPDAAMALADSQVGLDNPGLRGAWATYLAPTNTQQLGQARSRAAAAALLSGQPDLAGVTDVPEARFSPGLAISGQGEAPGTLGLQFGGVSLGDRPVDPRAQAYGAAPLASQGIGAVLGAGTSGIEAAQRQAELDRLRAQTARYLTQAESDQARAEYWRNRGADDTGLAPAGAEDATIGGYGLQ